MGGHQELGDRKKTTSDKTKSDDSLVPAVDPVSPFNNSPFTQQPETDRVSTYPALADSGTSATHIKEYFFMNNVAPLKVSSRSRNRQKTCLEDEKSGNEDKVSRNLGNEDNVLRDLSNLSVRPNTKEHLKPDLVPVQEIVPTLLLNGELQKLSLCEEPQDHDGRVTRRRSSILGSNTGEVDISFPPAARRSLTGSEVPRISLSPRGIGSAKKSFLSDSEEELHLRNLWEEDFETGSEKDSE